MIINREVILVKEEVTYNTDPVPTEGANAVLVENPAWQNEGLRMNERPAVRSSIGQLQHVYGGMLRTVTFDVELKGVWVGRNCCCRNLRDLHPSINGAQVCYYLLLPRWNTDDLNGLPWHC